MMNDDDLKQGNRTLKISSIDPRSLQHRGVELGYWLGEIPQPVQPDTSQVFLEVGEWRCGCPVGAPGRAPKPSEDVGSFQGGFWA